MQMTPEEIMYARFCGQTHPVNCDPHPPKWQVEKCCNSHRLIQGNRGHGEFGYIPALRGIEIGRTVTGAAHDLPLDRGPQNRAQHLYRHACAGQRWKISDGNDAMRKPVQRWHTIGSGRVPLRLICADEHGESWIRHMEALKSGSNRTPLRQRA